MADLGPSDSAFDSLIRGFRDEPSRTGSIVVTVSGDAIMPRGGSVWLGTLLAFFRALGIGEGAVRTAMSRLTADGWLERSRVGRNSFDRLGGRGRATFEAATEHIYHPRPLRWDGRFVLVWPPDGPARDTAGTALRAVGFGLVSPGLLIAPSGSAPAGGEAGRVRLVAEAWDEAGARLAARAWPLDWAGEAYRRFTATFARLRDELARGERLSEIKAFTARILLIHAYRRVILRDSILPAALLPAGWPGEEARRVCADLYRGPLPPSEAWLDRHGLDENGVLPPCRSRTGAAVRPKMMLQNILSSEAFCDM